MTFRPRLSVARAAFTESLAYAQSGVYAILGRGYLAHELGSDREVGVLFVPGVGAGSSQFRGLGEALQDVAGRFDGFDYGSHQRFEVLLPRLSAAIERASARSQKLVVVGHSLGGVLLRMLLQEERLAPKVAAFVAICAPLHGTASARFALSTDLRRLSPGSELVAALETTQHRLNRLSRVLTIGADEDVFVRPRDSAFLAEHATLRLNRTGHVGALFHPRTHQAVRELISDVGRGASQARSG